MPDHTERVYEAGSYRPMTIRFDHDDNIRAMEELARRADKMQEKLAELGKLTALSEDETRRMVGLIMREGAPTQEEIDEALASIRKAADDARS